VILAARLHQASDGAGGDQVRSDTRLITTAHRRPPIARDAGTAVGFGDRPPPQRMRLRNWRPCLRNTLRGFANVALPNGLQIDEIAVHVRRGRARASLPARPMLDTAGRHVVREGKPPSCAGEPVSWPIAGPSPSSSLSARRTPMRSRGALMSHSKGGLKVVARRVSWVLISNGHERQKFRVLRLNLQPFPRMRKPRFQRLETAVVR